MMRPSPCRAPKAFRQIPPLFSNSSESLIDKPLDLSVHPPPHFLDSTNPNLSLNNSTPASINGGVEAGVVGGYQPSVVKHSYATTPEAQLKSLNVIDSRSNHKNYPNSLSLVVADNTCYV